MAEVNREEWNRRRGKVLGTAISVERTLEDVFRNLARSPDLNNILENTDYKRLDHIDEGDSLGWKQDVLDWLIENRVLQSRYEEYETNPASKYNRGTFDYSRLLEGLDWLISYRHRWAHQQIVGEIGDDGEITGYHFRQDDLDISKKKMVRVEETGDRLVEIFLEITRRLQARNKIEHKEANPTKQCDNCGTSNWWFAKHTHELLYEKDLHCSQCKNRLVE